MKTKNRHKKFKAYPATQELWRAATAAAYPTSLAQAKKAGSAPMGEKRIMIYEARKEKVLHAAYRRKFKKNTGLLNKYRLCSYRSIVRKAVSVLRMTG